MLQPAGIYSRFLALVMGTTQTDGTEGSIKVLVSTPVSERMTTQSASPPLYPRTAQGRWVVGR